MFVEFLIAFAAVVIVWSLFTFAFRKTGPWKGFVGFFVILFLATWVLGSWMEPFGPAVYGVYGLPFLVVAIIIGLLLASGTPPYNHTHTMPHRDSADESSETTADADVATGIGAFFWAVLGVLLLAAFAQLLQ